MEVIGYLGAGLLALCALPQAIASFKQGHSRGIDSMFLWTWFIGEVLLLAYTTNQAEISIPLVANYFVNTVLVGVILVFKYSPMERK
jgi:uncharacterized protein with PQ loop repeat